MSTDRGARHARRTAGAGALLAVLALGLPAARTAATPQGPQVRVWIDDVEIPTYPLGADDPYPHFREIEGSLVYPYTFQDAFTTHREPRTYRGVYLENEYLRVLCLPELGGRIQSVFDKVENREMFYRNHVIRPGHIALRGAWVSGGIEWNRGPQGHTVTAFSPVSVRIHRNADGSASLLIGDIEQVHRTGWEARLTLHPGRRILDEEIRLFNSTDGFHPYYFWNNTAFPETHGTRFIFPMSLGTDHAGTRFFRWPVDDGRDLTWLRNYPGPTSVFGVDVDQDFFGAYDADADYGIVQVADHHRLPGKKAWTWGQADAGRVAESMLTDDDGPYIEVQSGPLQTQSDFAMLLPGQEVSWHEYWYPVQDLGQGLEYATRHAAVERHDLDDGVELRIAATGSYPGARLQVERDDGRTFRGVLDLATGRTEPFRVASSGLTEPAQMRLHVRLQSERGETLLEYDSPLQVPRIDPPPSAGERTPETAGERFRAGWQANLAGDRVEARRRYLQALEVDPGHADALRALGVLALESGRYDAATERLERSLLRDGEDGLSWALLGVSRLGLDDLDGAVDAGFEAVRRQGTAALGWGVIGRARARRGDYPAALDAFTAGLSAGGADWTRLFDRVLVATYATGDAQAASSMAARAVETGTLDPLPHVMGALSSRDSLDAAAGSARLWLGDADFAFVETSLAFEEQGLTRVAADVLEAGSVDTVEPDRRRPVPLLYLAWYAHRLGDDEAAERWLDAATAMADDGVFPSRRETLPVLRFAVEARPRNGRVREYLGNLYAGLGRLDEAEEAWRSAAELDPELAIARRNLALLAWRRDGDTEAAVRWLRDALAARPDDQRLARDLARIHLAAGDPQAAVDLLARLPAGEARRGDATLLLAESYLAAERYDDVIGLLEAASFTNREGDVSPWEAFHRAHVARGEQRLEGGDAEAALADFDAALTYPENLGAGRPAMPQEARALYGKARALTRLGRAEEARRAWQACAAETPATDELSEIVDRCAAQLRGGGAR